MTTEPSKRIWFVTVEGIGDQSASTSSKLYRWSSAPPPIWDADDLYRHCLAAGIDISAQSIDPRSGKSSSGGMTFGLNVELGDVHGVRSIFGRRYHESVGNLDLTISAQSAIPAVSIPGYLTGAGKTVFINREAFKLGTHSGSGLYIGNTRSILETTKQRSIKNVPVYEAIKVLKGRLVTLSYYDDDAASYGDEVIYQRYQLWDGTQQGLVQYRFTCDGLTAIMSQAKLLKDPWVGAGLRSAGSAASPLMYLEWQPNYRDGLVAGVRIPEVLRSARSEAKGGSSVARGGAAAEPIGGDKFQVSVSGTVYTATVGAVLTSAADGTVTQFAAFLSREPAFGGVPLNITDSTDVSSLDIREVCVSSPQSPSNGGSGTAALPLGSGSNFHPMGIWLQVVTSTPDGSNGAYDTGFDFGIRTPSAWIDFDAAETLINTDPESMRAERFIAGRESTPQLLLEKLDRELLFPAGVQRTESTTGLISFTRITDSDYLTTPISVGEDQLVLAVEMDESFRLAVTLDRLILEYDQDGSGKARSIPVRDNENTEESLGPVDTDTISGGAIQSRDIIVAAGIDYLVRWRTELPALAFATTMDVDARSGDSVNLTCLAVLSHDVAGNVVTEGVTDSRVLITSRQPDIEANMVVYTGLHTGIRDLDTAQVAPALRVISAVGETVTIKAAWFVGTGHLRGYTEDIDPWAVGDSAMVLSEVDMSIKQSGLVVASLATFTVVLTGLTAALVAGDVIVPDVYASSTPAQQVAWEYYDQGKEYEG